MKDKIAFLIIGMLLGAIFTTTGFLIYYKCESNTSNQMQMGMPSGQMGQMGEPPAKPEDMNNLNN